MAGPMNGTWELASSDNFEDYMKELGVSAPLRKLGNLAKPTLTVEVDENNFYHKNKNAFGTLELRAKIGEEFDEKTFDDRKVKTIFTWNGNKLVQTQKWDGKVTTHERYVDEQGYYINICKMNEVVCRRVYKKSKARSDSDVKTL